MVIKLFGLVFLWIAIGFVGYVVVMVQLFSRAFRMDSEKFLDILVEAVSIATYGIIDVSDGKRTSAKDQIENLTGRPYIVNVILNIAQWPSTLNVTNDRCNGALDIIENEYISGIRKRKENKAL